MILEEMSKFVFKGIPSFSWRVCLASLEEKFMGHLEGRSRLTWRVIPPLHLGLGRGAFAVRTVILRRGTVLRPYDIANRLSVIIDNSLSQTKASFLNYGTNIRLFGWRICPLKGITPTTAFDPFRTVISRVRTVILRVRTVISREGTTHGKM